MLTNTPVTGMVLTNTKHLRHTIETRDGVDKYRKTEQFCEMVVSANTTQINTAFSLA